MDITWNCGMRVMNPKSVVTISNPEPDSWTKKHFMARGRTLADAIRSGQVRSAWDDYDNEEDAFAGRKSEERVAESQRIQEEFQRLRREREEAARKQEEKMRLAREAEERRKREEAQEQLEALDGYGSF
jgi:hypothetical protein